MTTAIVVGRYNCERGGSGVIIENVDENSKESMLEVYNLASSTRDACNQYRTSACPENCKLKNLVSQVTTNLNELLK